MDEFTVGPLPPNPILISGDLTIGTKQRARNTTAEEDAMGLALREARVKLWRDLWQSREGLVCEVEHLHGVIRNLHKKIRELEGRLPT